MAVTVIGHINKITTFQSCKVKPVPINEYFMTKPTRSTGFLHLKTAFENVVETKNTHAHSFQWVFRVSLLC